MCADGGAAAAAASQPVLHVDDDRARAGRRDLAGARRWVVKVGSALLTRDGLGLDPDALERIAAELLDLAAAGAQPVLVSSGAVAAGVARLGLAERPEGIHELQAAAAVGQMSLIQAWESAFAARGRHAALVLLTHEDLADRTRHLNARATLRALLDRGVIPVINENDTVATDEIRFGDNDTLAALVTNLVEADVLVLLTDADGLRTADPRRTPEAPRVGCARAEDPDLDAMVGVGPGRVGRGGMATKLRAARIAGRSGARTVIAHGGTPVIAPLRAGEDRGTLLLPEQARLAARKRWIAGQLRERGSLVLDDGAVRVLREAGRSLLPVGVLAVEGRFERGDVVVCRDRGGAEVARGLVNYSDAEARRILGAPSDAIAERLGYGGEPELVHRDNLVVS